LYEGKREHDEQENNPGHKDKHGKDFAQIACKSDITEAKRGHHSESPIETCNPAKFSIFKNHYEMKKDTVYYDNSR
jgi:hypothetical protein